MDETDDPNTAWKFEIRGLVENTVNSLPLSDEHLEEAFKLDPDYNLLRKDVELVKPSFRPYNRVTE